jgi:geranylgeranyl pyrophosphate synthase
MPSLPPFFAPFQDQVDHALDDLVSTHTTTPSPVIEAMRYTLLAPSKRVRAVVVMLAAELGGPGSRALPAACAVECVHAASLMLDDLPSMDDASLRRGRPAAHIVFGEAITILAAFGLLADAFGHLANHYEPLLARQLAALLAEAVGPEGLVAGQAEDVLMTNMAPGFDVLERIHRRKTGVLFSAAATSGALTGRVSPQDTAALTAYAKNLGLAFQIVDDLLDVTGTSAETGKAVRRDARKTTFVSFSGIDGARELAGELCRTAASALEPFGPRAARLVALAEFVAARRS